MDERIVEFEGWEKVLRDTVPIALQAEYREAVAKFRYWLREKGEVANVEAFKRHLEWKKSYLPPKKYEMRRQALRWYFDKGKKTSSQKPVASSPKGAQESGDSKPKVQPPTGTPPPSTSSQENEMPDVPPRGRGPLPVSAARPAARG